jgi:hypothetical protein
MNIRRMLLSGVLVSGLTLTLVPRATAEPSPWSGMWDHSRHTDEDRDRDDRNYSRHRNGDRDYIRKGSSYRHDRSHHSDPRYRELVDRINHDRAKIAEIAPTGRNRKALQWFRDDLRHAERDMRNYRDLRTSNDYDSRDGYYDPSDEDGPPSFDWSGMLGTLLNPTR